MKKKKSWVWTLQRYSDGPEFSCRHGVGHSTGVHGCDGCCSDPNFPPTKANNLKYLEAKYNEEKAKE